MVRREPWRKDGTLVGGKEIGSGKNCTRITRIGRISTDFLVGRRKDGTLVGGKEIGRWEIGKGGIRTVREPYPGPSQMPVGQNGFQQ
jgi:hypothetical protein